MLLGAPPDTYTRYLPAVTVENAKVPPLILDVDDVRVFHRGPPTVHLCQAHAKALGSMPLQHRGEHWLRQCGSHHTWEEVKVEGRPRMEKTHSC